MYKLPNGEASFNKLLYSYKNNASKRGIIFKLKTEQFRKLTKMNCAYCGLKPKQVFNQFWGEGKKSTPYIYNGVDRINNRLGYTTKNCAPCCLLCNQAKRSLALKVFSEWVRRLVNFNYRERDRKFGRKE